MIRVLHIINHLNIGGAERMLVDSVNFLSRQYPNTTHIVFTLFKSGELSNELRDKKNIRVHNLNVKWYNFIFKAIQLKRFIRKNKIKNIHSHLFEASIFARLSLPKHVVCFTTIHNGYHNPASVLFSKKRLWLDKITYKKNVKFIYVSESVKKDQEISLKPTGESYVIPNFSSQKFYPAYRYKENKELRFISLGRLIEQKMQLLQIAALQQLSDITISIDIYGDGPLKKELNDVINQHQVRVNILENRPITPELFNQYDAFIMSSVEEGMSIALIEALTVGMPCLLSNIDSFRETAENAAIYFESGSADDLAQKLRYIFDHKVELAALSKKSLILSTKYSIESYCQTLIELYNENE